jgi:hypothetical protein
MFWASEWAIEMYQQGDSFPAVETLMNYRSQGEDNLFELWCNTFFQPGYGTAAFRYRCKKKTLSEILTVYDEAFIVATIDNNCERWMKEAELLSQGNMVDKKRLPRQKYTNDAAASKKYQGWSTEGLDFFNKTVNDLNQLRNMSASKALEKNYMENQNHEMQAKKTRKGATVPETQAVDGLQAYLKSFFPNLANKSLGSGGAERTPAANDRPDKRRRISASPDCSSEEDPEDIDNLGGYDGFDDGDIGQTRGV